jgi:UDP-N-acetyl-D-mannosaminuronate dehydrogenase
MTDVILGMGEVGTTLFEILEERGVNCIGIDNKKSKCKNYFENKSVENVELLHICIPGEIKDFEEVVKYWINKMRGLKAIMIHSTVRPGTTKNIQKNLDLPVLFSPIRGVHRRFLEDMRRYSKFVSSDMPLDMEIKTGLEKRFEKIQWMSTTKTAEFAKILVDTAYYGWLINYAQITKMICEEEKIDFDEMWKFADEIHEKLGNRPKMYPGIIGGHCVIPNLNLVNNESLEMIKKINELFEKYHNSKN